MGTDDTRDVHELFAVAATILLAAMAMILGYVTAVRRADSSPTAIVRMH